MHSKKNIKLQQHVLHYIVQYVIVQCITYCTIYCNKCHYVLTTSYIYCIKFYRTQLGCLI